MLAPTYTLKHKSSPDSDYFSDVATAADEVTKLSEPLRAITEAYGLYLAETTGHTQASHEQLTVELLVISVLFRARGAEASSTRPSVRNLVTELVRERREGKSKRRDGSQNCLLDFERVGQPGSPVPTLAELSSLSDWLLATGEYDDEARLIDSFVAYLRTGRVSVELALNGIFEYASQFEVLAERVLGRYTERVPTFLREKFPLYREREDAAQCSRGPLEYHLSMVGAELLNRAWQAAYLASSAQVLVVPGCLRAHRDESCRARRTETALECSHCRRDCVVSQATRVAERYGKKAVAVVHGSDFSRFLRAAAGKGTAIIGVACAPGILGAGFRAKALGIEAQCILLDASGCDHWVEQGAPSSFHWAELERILSGRGRGDCRPAAAERLAS